MLSEWKNVKAMVAIVEVNYAHQILTQML